MKIDLVDGASSGTVQTALAVVSLRDIAAADADYSMSKFASSADMRHEMLTEIATLRAKLVNSQKDVDYWIRQYTEARQAEIDMRRELDARGWHPIETAPKDGTLVDFYVPNGGTARARADDYWSGADWLKRATHWMPLPAPPGTVQTPKAEVR